MDFAILGSDGAPAVQVALYELEHEHLMGAAQQWQFQQLLRAHDYYGEVVTYVPDEVRQLTAELQRIQSLALDAGTAQVVRELSELCASANAQRAAIHVLPD